MKKFAGMFMVVAFASVSALGGTVEFMNPSSGGSVLEIFQDDTGTAFGTYEVHITASSIDPFNSTDIIFASDDLLFSAWAFSDAFVAATSFRAESDTPNQISGVLDEYKVGGVNLGGNLIPVPIMVGTLTIIVPADLAIGTYNVFVDNAREANGVSKVSSSTAGADPDPLFGLGTVNVTPEPTTLVLLGVGAVVALRRRRQLA